MNAHNYEGFAWVHWSMSMKHRAQGWLDDDMHREVRELLLHACVRSQLVCSAYTLMPDHAHIFLMGLDSNSDQNKAVRFFRRAWNSRLKTKGVTLQREAYEHVLREDERRPEAFEDTVLYICKNAEKAGLVAFWPEWKYSGAVVMGYPDLPLDPIADYWPLFWRLYSKLRKPVG